jgi:hypothetical protein
MTPTALAAAHGGVGARAGPRRAALHQVVEERLERGVWAGDALDGVLVLERHLRDLGVGLVGRGRAEGDGVRVHLDAGHGRVGAQHQARELTRALAAHVHVVGVLVQQVADLGDLALRHQLAARDEHDAVGEGLHLVQHVRGEQHHGAGGRAVAQGLEDDLLAARVRAGERLVQDEHVGLVHDALRQLGALPHAAAVAPHAALHGVGQAEHAERIGSAVARFLRGVAAQLGHGGHLLEGGELVVHGVGFGAEAHAAQHLGVGERSGAAHAHAAQAGAQLARGQAQEGGLARAVGPQQAPDAGPQVQGHVLQRGDLPVPLGELHGADAGGVARHVGLAGLGRARGAGLLGGHAMTSTLRMRW